MLSKADSRKKAGGVSGNGKFLSDLETISKAYYVDKTRPRLTSSTASSRSKSVGKPQLSIPKTRPEDAKNKTKDLYEKDKKSSIWSWKGLKALTNARSHRFNCCFSLLVHNIEGLPVSFNNICLVVHWKRRDGEHTTRSIRVHQGVAEFEEQLTHTCSVYGSRNGPHHSAKYEAKHFLLYVSIFDAPEVDLGRHRVDMTRLLPLTLEELQEEKSSGKWTTSYRLSGKAKGATINVSFGYIVENDSPEISTSKNDPENLRLWQNSARIPEKDKLEIYTAGSLPAMSSSANQSSEDFKDLHEVLPTSRSELYDSMNILYQKLDEEFSSTAAKSSLEDDTLSSHAEPHKVNMPTPLHEVLPTSRSELYDSVNILYQKLDEEFSSTAAKNSSEDDTLSTHVEPHKVDLCTQLDAGENMCETECGMADFSVTDKGVEELTQEQVNSDEESSNAAKYCGEDLEDKNDVKSTPKEDAPVNLSATEVVPQNDDQSKHSPNNEEKAYDMDSKELLLKELDEALNCTSGLVDEEFDSREDESNGSHLINNVEVNPDDMDRGKGKSHSLDDVTDSVASDFLKMLGMEQSPVGLSSESEPESPRERLLRQFEKDILANGGGLLNFDMDDDPTEVVDDIPTGSAWGTISDDLHFDHSSGSASDLLKMLGMQHSPIGLSSEIEPELPRELPRKQYHIDDNSAEVVNDIPTGSAWGTISDDFIHPSVFEGFKETSEVEIDAFRTTKPRGFTMEDLETEALMREWGLNEKAFQHSPKSNSGNFGNPTEIPTEDPQQVPPLAEGLGPFMQTKDGGFIRSMNPALFKNAERGGNLIMQVSNPVVVPAEMGAGVMDILQGLASVGIEKLSMQANKLMPLEDITGKTMQQIAWEGAQSLEGPERREIFHQEPDIEQRTPSTLKTAMGVPPVSRSNKTHSNTHSSDMEYVSLEDLAPLAMDKIEALSMEGLRIQSGMSDEEAPSNISAQSIGEFSALKGKTVTSSGSIALDGAGGLQLLDIKDNGEDMDDGLMSLSLTLDEWVKLDSGEIDDDDLVCNRTSKILAAHHATSLEQFRGRSKGEKRRGRSRKYGLLGNNFTVALLVQLRNPLRNYEPVGAPMLALIQVERVFVPPKPKIYSTVSLVSESNEDEEAAAKSNKPESIVEKPKDDKVGDEELIPQYKVAEVHVAGLKTEQGKKKLWGSTNQQQAGSRWLLANGMGKKNKHPLMKAKAVGGKSSSGFGTTTIGGQPQDSMWSVSSSGKGTKLKEVAGWGMHNRNPNVILPK